MSLEIVDADEDGVTIRAETEIHVPWEEFSEEVRDAVTGNRAFDAEDPDPADALDGLLAAANLAEAEDWGAVADTASRLYQRVGELTAEEDL